MMQMTGQNRFTRSLSVGYKMTNDTLVLSYSINGDIEITNIWHVIFLRIVVHITVSLFEGSMEYAFHNAHVDSI